MLQQTEQAMGWNGEFFLYIIDPPPQTWKEKSLISMQTSISIENKVNVLLTHYQ